MSKFKVDDRVIADPTDGFVVAESRSCTGTVVLVHNNAYCDVTVRWDQPCGDTFGYYDYNLVPAQDSVNHPSHYKSATGLEVIDVIEAFDLDRYLANVVKYILRSPSKGNEVEDLKKAVWYLQRKIDRLETGNE